MQRGNLAAAVEPVPLQVLEMKQREGHQVGTFRPAQEAPGAADLEQVKQESSCCSPCVGWPWAAIWQCLCRPWAQPGHAAAQFSRCSLWKSSPFCCILNCNVFSELQDTGQGQLCQGSSRRGSAAAGLMMCVSTAPRGYHRSAQWSECSSCGGSTPRAGFTALKSLKLAQGTEKGFSQ